MVSALTAEERGEEIRGLLLLYPAFCIADDWNARFPRAEEIPESEELWGMKLGRRFFESIRGFQIKEHNDVYIDRVSGLRISCEGVIINEYVNKGQYIRL